MLVRTYTIGVIFVLLLAKASLYSVFHLTMSGRGNASLNWSPTLTITLYLKLFARNTNQNTFFEKFLIEVLLHTQGWVKVGEYCTYKEYLISCIPK